VVIMRFHTRSPFVKPSSLMVAVVLFIDLSQCRPALAQSNDAQPQRAQGLFDEARMLMERGIFAEACLKLQASYRLDPATGTLLNLAFCLENEGSTAAAYRTYEAAQQRAIDEGNDERKQFAAARLKSLESRLVRLVFPSKTRESGFWVQCDSVLARSSERAAVCVVEPGKHRIAYGAPGKMPDTVQIDASQTGSESIVQLRHLVDVASSARPIATPPNRPAPISRAASSGGLDDRTLAAISFGIAAVGAAGTVYLGWRAKSEWDERNGYCSSGCDERALAAGHRANDYAWAANVAGAATLLSAGFGTYLLLRPKPSSAATVFTGAFTTDRSGAMLMATFVP
jgi:tetratricopeptide (TPR) repeat protein